MPTRHRAAAAALTLLLLGSACSSPDSPPAGPEPAAEDQPAAAGTPTPPDLTNLPATAQLTAQDLGGLAGEPDFTGTATLTVLDIVDLGPTVPAGNLGGDDEQADSDATFIGVRYELANDGSTRIQPAVQVNDDLRITDDGRRSWTSADYTNGRSGVSAHVAVNAGDDDPATFAQPGLAVTTWAAFVVPTGVDPATLVVALPVDPPLFLRPAATGDPTASSPTSRPPTGTPTPTGPAATPATSSPDPADVVLQLDDLPFGWNEAPVGERDEGSCFDFRGAVPDGAAEESVAVFTLDPGSGPTISGHVTSYDDPDDAQAWAEAVLELAESCDGQPISPGEDVTYSVDAFDVPGVDGTGRRIHFAIDGIGSASVDVVVTAVDQITIVTIHGGFGPQQDLEVTSAAHQAMTSRA